MENKMNINWFPGHMAKAIREIKEKVNLVDIVIELSDARAITSSMNPIIKEIIGNKFYLKIISKIDLADEKVTNEWKSFFKEKQVNALFVDLNKKEYVKQITSKIKEITDSIVQRDIRRGLKPRSIRAMVLGIPNVGKSTFINAVTNKKSAAVGNKPGFTRAQRWVFCNGFELLDTPGILWPNLSENEVGIKLAMIGCIKEEILPELEMLKYSLEFLHTNYDELLYNKYGISYESFEDYIDKFSLKRGHLLKNNEKDYSRSALTILNDLKNGNIGKISIDKVGDRSGKF